jgi:hypothetical protein
MADARRRFASAKEFLDVAELIVDERDENASLLYSSAAASLAVLAGIAAADAACCAVLQERSRSRNHHDAEGLVAQIEPDGKQAARGLRELVNLKDKAQYGVLAVGPTELTAVMRKARQLVAFAETTLRR